jgi:hypothetical protein
VPNTVVELDRAEVWVREVEVGLRAAVVRGLHSAALRAVQVVVTQIIPSRSPQPVDRGVYRAGWRAVLLPDGADVENLEPVAPLVEDGVRAANVKPGRAMIRALASWVVRKGLASPEDAEHVAWAIAKTMQVRGIFGRGQGLGILRELVDRRLDAIVREEVEREIARFGG